MVAPICHIYTKWTVYPKKTCTLTLPSTTIYIHQTFRHGDKSGFNLDTKRGFSFSLSALPIRLIGHTTKIFLPVVGPFFLPTLRSTAAPCLCSFPLPSPPPPSLPSDPSRPPHFLPPRHFLPHWYHPYFLSPPLFSLPFKLRCMEWLDRIKDRR